MKRPGWVSDPEQGDGCSWQQVLQSGAELVAHGETQLLCLSGAFCGHFLQEGGHGRGGMISPPRTCDLPVKRKIWPFSMSGTKSPALELGCPLGVRIRDAAQPIVEPLCDARDQIAGLPIYVGSIGVMTHVANQHDCADDPLALVRFLEKLDGVSIEKDGNGVIVRRAP